MKQLIFSSILIISGFFSCTKKNYEKPDNLISQSEMIEIMTDLYISQQGIQMYPVQNEDQSLNMAKDAVDIMKSYDITYSEFSDNYKYYIMQPEKFKKMLDDVKDNLNDKLSDEEKERQADQKKIMEEENKKNQAK